MADIATFPGAIHLRGIPIKYTVNAGNQDLATLSGRIELETRKSKLTGAGAGKVSFESFTEINTTPLLRGSSDLDTDITVTVDVESGQGGGQDDVYTTKSLGGKWELATDPFEIQDKIIVESQSDDPLYTYYIDPNLYRMADGRILMTVGAGKGHISNEDKAVYYTSDSEGETWSSETTLLENPTSIFDNGGIRAPSGGVDPETGRVIIFYTVKSGVGDYIKTGYMYSDDNAQTWSQTTEITHLFDLDISGFIPFNRMQSTIHGLCMVYCHIGEAYTLFSHDNGITWGDINVIFETGTNDGFSWAETSLIKIDDYRLVVLARSQDQPSKYGWSRSNDGGRTWTSIVDFNAPTVTVPAPIWGRTIGEQVYIALGTRRPVWSMFTNRIAKEDFWHNPARAYSSTEHRRSLFTFLAEDSDEHLNCGYPDILEINDGHYTALLVYYDQNASGLTDDTDVRLRTFPLI